MHREFSLTPLTAPHCTALLQRRHGRPARQPGGAVRPRAAGGGGGGAHCQEGELPLQVRIQQWGQQNSRFIYSTFATELKIFENKRQK